jgi:hypothetical protein
LFCQTFVNALLAFRANLLQGKEPGIFLETLNYKACLPGFEQMLKSDPKPIIYLTKYMKPGFAPRRHES